MRWRCRSAHQFRFGSHALEGDRLAAQGTTPVSPSTTSAKTRPSLTAALRRGLRAAQAIGLCYRSVAMKSTVGRPRMLTDEKVEKILAWDEARRRLKTRKELALELGVSESAIGHAIRRRGQYKQPSPERRHSEVAERQRLLSRLASR